jgi:uncharacterized Rmd1/YagE family protein
MKIKFWISILLLTVLIKVNAQVISSIEFHVNTNIGNDTANGTSKYPLKTLTEAAKRVNELNGKGSLTIILSEGTYGLHETAKFNPKNRELNKENRLVIRSEVLPNDLDWAPGKMPIIVSTMPFKLEKNDKNEVTDGANYGIEINASYVTIQGLKILGEPVHENPKKDVLIRNYPIVWEGNNLTDLNVTQCLFLGNKFALPNHLGILANGSNLNVDHCVFYGVKDAVVMWNNKADNSSMHHNLILNSYGAVVWTWSTTDDFKFYNNVISNSNVLWVLDKEEKYSFKINNSMIVGYNQLVNKGGGPKDFGIPANSKKLIYNSSFKISKKGSLEIEEDQTSKFYLQLKPGTKGTEYGAGLFYN